MTLRKKNNHSRILLAVIPASLLLAAAGTAFLYFRASGRDELCAENVARLKEIESADISATEQQLLAMESRENAEQTAAAKEGIKSSETILSNVEIRQAFSGSVIVGDSITESIREYGYLDTDVVISKRGLRIDDADEQLDTAIGLHPRNLFLAFGTNDMELYNGDTKGFIEAYRVKIQKLQEALPDTPIYINSILPVLPSAIEQVPALGYYPDFNQALADFCAETGCIFIDNTFLVEGNESMYEPDGEHVIADYYPKWLTYMAETAGL